MINLVSLCSFTNLSQSYSNKKELSKKSIVLFIVKHILKNTLRNVIFKYFPFLIFYTPSSDFEKTFNLLFIFSQSSSSNDSSIHCKIIS